ncbi:MAG: twin-arginine translocation signal domain-containing protein [Candidatus Competibacteraceae bacterium]
MTDPHDEQQHDIPDEAIARERRDFLRGLGKWSQAVIGGVLLGGAATLVPQARAGAWINRRGGYGGGGWINGGGGGWINRRGGYGGGSWINRRW